MSDVADHTRQTEADVDQSVNEHLSLLQQKLASLREAHTDLNPVAVRRVEALLRRASSSRSALATRLLSKAEAVLEKSELAVSEANQAPAVKATPSILAELIDMLQQRYAASAADDEPATFEALLRRQEVDALRQMDDEAAVADLDALAPVAELKALQEFREEWARRSTERAVNKALEEAPEDAGPLNAHRLVVRSLMAMQDVSPDYLGRFVNYVETLLWLEQAGARLLPKESKAGKGKRRH